MSAPTAPSTRTLLRSIISTSGPRIKRALAPLSFPPRLLASFPDATNDRNRTMVLSPPCFTPIELPSNCVSYNPSPSNTKLACLIEEDGGKKLTVEVWDHNALKHSIRVDEVHGPFIVSEQLGGLTWSQKEDMLVYVADRLHPNKPPEEFVYNEDDLGEQYVDVFDPVLVLLSLASSDAPKLVGRGCSPVFSPTINASLACVLFPHHASKLGITYCPTRPSEIRLYHDVTSTTSILLSAPASTTGFGGPSAKCPRFTPDGTGLVFLGSANTTIHNGPSQLFHVDLTASSAPPRCVVDVVKTCSTYSDFPSLYVDSLPAQCMYSNYLFCNTLWGICKRLVRIDLVSGEVVDISDQDDHPPSSSHYKRARGSRSEYSHTLLGVHPEQGGLVIFRSAPTDPGYVEWTVNNHRETFPIGTKTWHDEVHCEIAHHQPDSFPSLLLNRPGADKLVVLPHGGPHSANTTEFIPEIIFLCTTLNASVLFVNYRGSLGQAQSVVESLPGKCGDQDVADVHQVVLSVRDRLKPSSVFLCGGSHGGFISAHLSCRYPDVYSACVLRNPVINMTHLVATSDIPDWAWVETFGLQGFTDKRKAQFGVASPDDLKRMFEVSPVSHLGKAGLPPPTLMHLGFGDRRVPHSQGMEWVRALRHMNASVEVMRYPKDGHAIDRSTSSEVQWAATVEFLRRR
jgi:acylaminoacyl-peptidase